MAHHDYLRSVDGLRGFAIALVLYNHSTQLLSGVSPKAVSGIWHGSPGAWLGVDLFFVVSGFLITQILLRAKDTPGALRRFWLRRALRIFPLAYLYLLLLVVAARVLPGYAALRQPAAIATIAFYLTNFDIALHGWGIPGVGILWSLAVEEQFYTAWPLLVLYRSQRTLVRLLVGLVVLTPLLRFVVGQKMGTTAAYVLTFCRWDALAVGALVAFARCSDHWAQLVSLARKLLPFAWFVVLAVLAVPFGPAHAQSPWWFEVFGYSFIALACAVLLIDALSGRLGISHAAWRLEPLVQMGKRCYGLYLWHVLAADITWHTSWKLGIHSFEGRALLWLATTLAMAIVSYRFFESPVLRLKDRLGVQKPVLA